jgi:hypothetical protein
MEIGWGNPCRCRRDGLYDRGVVARAERQAAWPRVPREMSVAPGNRGQQAARPRCMVGRFLIAAVPAVALAMAGCGPASGPASGSSVGEPPLIGTTWQLAPMRTDVNRR